MNPRTIAAATVALVVGLAACSADNDTTEREGPQVDSARRSAKSHIEARGFSREGLIDQLEYEWYTVEDATAAVDSLDVDWNIEAVETAESYLELSEFPREGLVGQLIYEGFTPDEAEFGVSTVLSRDA